MPKNVGMNDESKRFLIGLKGSFRKIRAERYRLAEETKNDGLKVRAYRERDKKNIIR